MQDMSRGGPAEKQGRAEPRRITLSQGGKRRGFQLFRRNEELERRLVRNDPRRVREGAEGVHRRQQDDISRAEERSGSCRPDCLSRAGDGSQVARCSASASRSSAACLAGSCALPFALPAVWVKFLELLLGRPLITRPNS